MMHIQDIIVIIIITMVIAGSFFISKKRKSKGKCCMDCNSCGKCKGSMP